MRKIIDRLFYISLFFLPLSFVFRGLDWVGYGILMLLGLSAISIYYIAKSLKNILNKEVRTKDIIIHLLIILMSFVLFTKYFHIKFGDIFGFIIVPVFIFFSARYILNLIKTNVYETKTFFSIILFLLFIIPLFLSYNNGPRKYLPEEWWPENVDQSKYRNENWSWWVDSKTGKGIWIPIADEITVKTGNYTLFFFNGKIREKGKLVDGKNTDTAFVFDINENLIKYKLIRFDKVIQYYIHDGLYKDFFSTGEIFEEGIAQNHERGERWTRYFKNGKVEWTENLKNRTGWTVWYYDNGQVFDSAYHINGLGNGRIKHWYKNGKLNEETVWENGIQNGVSKIYYENGQLKQSSFWVKGEIEGQYEGWFENGNKKFIQLNKNNLSEGESTTWYSNGNFKNQGSYKNGEKHGKFIFYHENGKLKSVGNCENGKQVGEWYWYDDNGKLFQKDTYDYGELINVAKF